MKLDLSRIPFSRYGSFFAISYDEREKKLRLRDVHGGDESPSELFEIQFLRSDQTEMDLEKDIRLEVEETYFVAVSKADESQRVEIIFPEADSLHLRTAGLQVRLKADKVRYDSLNRMGEDIWEYISYKKETRYLLHFCEGEHVVDAPWKRVGNEYITIDLISGSELFIRNYKVVPPRGTSVKDFELSQKEVNLEYQSWLKSMPKVPAFLNSSKEMASYLLWANTVRKEGLLTEEVTYMSKNWMQNIWSWDNCFNAVLLSNQHPELAYSQLQVFIDYQDESGAYPDFINDKYVSYNCVKPPIHAWAYKLMKQKNPYFSVRERLESMYVSLCHNTNFWLEQRISEKGGLPYYTHGNDSGWDNASIFQHGLPVNAPDLTAYLVQQMDILAEFASELGLEEEAKQWQKEADTLFRKLMTKQFDGKQFFALHAVTGKPIAERSSAILFLPLVVAYRMDSSQVEQVVDQLLSRFEGEFGIATEEYTSPYFQEDGYWLGPIWAPETYIFVDALARAGYQAEAHRLAEKYCRLTLEGGMAENFNPLTGEGNDDLAFAWTSSVFLLLAQALQLDQGGG